MKRIADIMRKNYTELTGRRLPESEYNTWDHSLGEVKNLVELSKLTDLYFSFEYQVPYCQQWIDCLIFEKNSIGKGRVIHIELNAWQKVEATEIEGNYVETYTGGGTKRVPHPSSRRKDTTTT